MPWNCATRIMSRIVGWSQQRLRSGKSAEVRPARIDVAQVDRQDRGSPSARDSGRSPDSQGERKDQKRSADRLMRGILQNAAPRKRNGNFFAPNQMLRTCSIIVIEYYSSCYYAACHE